MMQRQSVRHQLNCEKSQDLPRSQSNAQTQYLQNASQQFQGKQCYASGSSSHHSSKALMKQTEHINELHGRSYEQENNLQALHSKLHSETENILKWKVSTELEMSQKERKLLETEEIVERQRKNLFELQMHSEQLSQRLQIELKNREELSSKIENTRNICSIIRDHCNKLTNTLNVCVDEKENLKSMYTQQSKDLESLNEHYKEIDAQYKTEMEQMEELVREERTQRNKVIAEANAMHTLLNEKVEELEKNYVTEKEVSTRLNQELQQNLEKISLLEIKNVESVKSLQSFKNQVNELESQLKTQKHKFELDIKDALSSIEQERVRCKMLKDQFDASQEKLKQLEITEEKMMSENAVLKETVEKQGKTCHQLNEEIFRIEASQNIVLAERDKLLSDLKELEEDHKKLQVLGLEYENIVQEHALAMDREKDAKDKIDVLENACEDKEKKLNICADENKRMVEELCFIKESMNFLEDKLTTAELQETALKQKIHILEEETSNLRSKLSSLESKSSEEMLELTALIEERQADSIRKDDELKTLSEEVGKLECHKAELQEQGKVLLEQIKKLEQENETIRKAFDGEVEKVDTLNDKINTFSGKNEELLKDMKEFQEQANERAKIIESLALEKEEMEKKIVHLEDLLGKASQDRNNFEQKFLDAVKERDTIQRKSDSEIKEMVAVLEKYKRECDGIVSQKEANITKLSNNLEDIHKKKEDLEEQVMKLQKENNSSLKKLADLDKEKDIVEKTLQVKVMDLELKLTAKEKEMAEKEVAKLKNEANKSPYMERVLSTPSRIHSSAIRDKNLTLTPKSGLSPAPQLTCTPRQNPSILKEPNTPGCNKKQVTFMEDTSDTDASSVDAMIIDNSDLMSRFEALERGVKMMTPIRVFPSPKNRKKMELKKADNQLKNEENNPDFVVKKARMMRSKPMNEDHILKGKKYQDGSGYKKLLQSVKHSDMEEGRNTGLDLDELFEIVED